MEKRTHSIRKNFWPAKLYLDDIMSIITILKENGFEKINIETASGTYPETELVSIEENDFIEEISAYNWIIVSIKFKTFLWEGVELYWWDDSVLIAGIFQKISEILIIRKRKMLSLFINEKFYYISIFTLLTISYLSSLYKQSIILNYIEFLLLAIVLCWFFLILLTGKSLIKKNIIYLQKEKNLPSFWKRNSDQLILSVVSGAAGAIATWLIVWK